MSNFKMDDYVPVNERIEAFYAAWPTGTLQSEIVELTPERVTVKAYAYRSEEDTRPGIGHSSLEIPGSTSFTRGSEIENAETSAWGRAIAALGFEVKRGIASREEVRDKQPDGSERATAGGRAAPATTSHPVQRTVEEQALLDQILAVPGMSKARMTLMADGVGVPKTRRANADELRAMIARFIETPQSDGPVSDAATVPSEGDPPLSAAPAPDDLMDDILAVTNGELVEEPSQPIPPEPGTPEYKALPSGMARSQAKAFWDAQAADKPEEPSLAEQLGATLA